MCFFVQSTSYYYYATPSVSPTVPYASNVRSGKALRLLEKYLKQLWTCTPHTHKPCMQVPTSAARPDDDDRAVNPVGL